MYEPPVPDLALKKKKMGSHWTGGMAQALECLLGKCKVPEFKFQHREGEKEREEEGKEEEEEKEGEEGEKE
jgi:hypothetical protein